MAVHARFSPNGGSAVEFKDIEGYRIAAFCRPAGGFGEAFYVYIHERLNSAFDFNPVDIASQAQGALEGTLSFSNDAQTIDYAFESIYLHSVQTFLTQQMKERYLTFKYVAGTIRKGNYCTLSNSTKSKSPTSAKTRTGQDYAYKIGNAPEPLLFFGSRLIREGNNIFRLGAIRNESNSFIELAMKIDAESRAPGAMQPKTVLVKDMNLTFDRDTLQGMLVDESYGTFMDFGVNSLDRVFEDMRTNNDVHLTAIDFSTFTPKAYLMHSRNPDTLKGGLEEASVETATIVIDDGEQLKQSSSIV